MESMLLWIIMFSGAAVVLLAVFLIASERELKKKRGEINQLLDRLESAPASASANAGDAGEANGLRTKTQELLKEIASLQDDLNAAHRAINELRAGKPDPANETTLAQVEQLRFANTQLDAQVEELRAQLQAGEARWASAADANSQQRQSQLENSLIDLKQQLEHSQARVRALENQPAPDTTLSEAQPREERDKLEARITQLQETLNAAAEGAGRADILRQQLGESEKTAQELREALRQRDEELPRWREQIAASEEIKKRIQALQPVYDQLMAKQSTLIDQQRAYQGELKCFAEFLSASHDSTIAPTYTYFDPENRREESLPSQLMLTPLAAEDGQATLAAPIAAATASAVLANGDDPASATEAKRGFGIFHALIALVVGGALVALFLSQSGNNPSANAAKPLPQSAPAQKTTAQSAMSPSEVASAGAPAKPAIEVPVPAQELPKKTQPATAAAAGVYQVTQATPVFAAPAEYAQQVGEIEPGLKVTVVNARDGWLEIHSKHGRPPGFIRSHTAARIDG